MPNHLEACLTALKQGPLTLYQAMAITRLGGWDAAQALNYLAASGHAVKYTDTATLWRAL